MNLWIPWEFLFDMQGVQSSQPKGGGSREEPVELAGDDLRDRTGDRLGLT